MLIRRGDIFYADLRPVIGSEQGGVRPVLIIQNDTGNRHSPTVICAAITSKMNKAKLPTHVEIESSRYNMVRDSVILLEQLRTIDKKRLKDKVCHLDTEIRLSQSVWIYIADCSRELDYFSVWCYHNGYACLLCRETRPLSGRMKKQILGRERKISKCQDIQNLQT